MLTATVPQLAFLLIDLAKEEAPSTHESCSFGNVAGDRFVLIAWTRERASALAAAVRVATGEDQVAAALRTRIAHLEAENAALRDALDGRALGGLS